MTRSLIWTVPALALAMQICASADTIAPGTQIIVRVDHEIDLHSWDRGRIYPGHVARDVWAKDGYLVIPNGSPAELIVRQTGPHQLTLDLECVTVNEGRFVMDTGGPQFNMPNAEYRQATGLVAKVVGALSGAKVEVQTQGNAIRIPPDSTLTFQLLQPLHDIGPVDPGYSQNGEHYHREGDWYR